MTVPPGKGLPFPYIDDAFAAGSMLPLLMVPIFATGRRGQDPALQWVSVFGRIISAPTDN